MRFRTLAQYYRLRPVNIQSAHPICIRLLNPTAPSQRPDGLIVYSSPLAFCSLLQSTRTTLVCPTCERLRFRFLPLSSPVLPSCYQTRCVTTAPLTRLATSGPRTAAMSAHRVKLFIGDPCCAGMALVCTPCEPRHLGLLTACRVPLDVRPSWVLYVTFQLYDRYLRLFAPLCRSCYVFRLFRTCHSPALRDLPLRSIMSCFAVYSCLPCLLDCIRHISMISTVLHVVFEHRRWVLFIALPVS